MKILKADFKFWLPISVIALLFCCESKNTTTLDSSAISEVNTNVSTYSPKTVLTKAFNDYWFAGEAEISSYKLEQARYGEIRKGQAVLVFVTEDFLPEIQVKANNYSKKNIPVLKLNSTKNFNTGIYPYSIMQSTFYPISNDKHALKISASIQEWCGQVYTQLNNREKFEVMSHSYFQGEADKSFKLEKSWTENELWTKLRIDPKDLPVGELKIIPSLEYTRLSHKDIKPYNAIASLENNSYTIIYPDLNRTLKINYNKNFPYDILGWEETATSGYGVSARTLTTKATKLESIKSAYWNENSNADERLRETLKLK
jgi:hypothetical protein